MSWFTIARMGAQRGYGEKVGDSVYVEVDFSGMKECLMESEYS